MFDILTLPGLAAFTAIGTFTVPSPFSGMKSLKAWTREGAALTSTPTSDSSETCTADSFKNRIDLQSHILSSPISI